MAAGRFQENVPMLKHSDLWQAIDRLAVKHGLSPSGLARQSGLDPTTFNKSKRIAREGRQRWPSTESVAKILEATGATLTEFVALIEGSQAGGPGRRIPLVGLDQADSEGMFDDQGRPAGKGWDEMLFPRVDDTGIYALEIGNRKLGPLYRDGDVMVVSPRTEIRPGDRVVVKQSDGPLLIGQLLRRGVRRVRIAPIDGAGPIASVPTAKVAWIARIIWSSQ